MGALCFRAVFCSKTIIPDSEEHPLASSRAVPKAVLRWIRDKDKEKTEFSSDDRDSSFRAANQHIVKFTDELRGVNEQAAVNFDRRKNPAEFDMSERKEMVEAVEKAFNQTGWNSASERRTTAAR